jgi:hypothetical protein
MPTSKSNSDTTFSNEPQRIPQTPYEQRNGIPLLTKMSGAGIEPAFPAAAINWPQDQDSIDTYLSAPKFFRRPDPKNTLPTEYKFRCYF